MPLDPATFRLLEDIAFDLLLGYSPSRGMAIRLTNPYRFGESSPREGKYRQVGRKNPTPTLRQPRIPTILRPLLLPSGNRNEASRQPEDLLTSKVSDICRAFNPKLFTALECRAGPPRRDLPNKIYDPQTMPRCTKLSVTEMILRWFPSSRTSMCQISHLGQR